MKSFFVFLIVLLPAFTHTSAQDLYRIGNISVAIREGEDVERVDLYNEMAWEYRKSDPDTMIHYASKAIDLAKELNLKDKLAQSFNYMGIAYHYKGDAVKSFDYYHMAMEEAIKHDDSIQYAHSLNSLGRLFFTQGDFIKAYDYYFIALNIFKKLNDRNGLSYCLKSLSELYQTQNNYPKAMEMSEQALSIRLESGNVPGQISLLIELAQIHEHNEDYDKAFDYYLKAKIKAETLNDIINIANANIGIAHLYCLQSNYSEALVYAKKALELAGDTGNNTLVSQIYIQLGRIYFLEGEYDQAKYYYNEVLKNSKRLKNLKLQQDSFFYLAEICEVKGNINCAYDNFQRHAAVKEALNNAEVVRSIERLESRLEIENRERENEILKASQRADQAIIDKQRIYNTSLGIAAIAFLILLVNFWVTSRKRKVANEQWQRKNIYIAEQQEEIKAKNEMIFYQNQELQKHNVELAELNKEKDVIMSIVAHDLKSPLNRVKGISDLLRLSALNEEQRHYVTLLKKVSKGGLNLIRDLLEVNAFENDKRKLKLSKVNIHTLLLEKTQGFSDDADQKQIQLKIASDSPGIVIHSDEVYLSRILDNLISNAIKFSTPGKSVILKEGRNEEGVFISIKDFGQGFTEEDQKKIYRKFSKLSAQPTAGESSNGLGLAIVKIMVNKLGAKIALETEVGKGSEFIIKFPAHVEVKEIVNTRHQML